MSTEEFALPQANHQLSTNHTLFSDIISDLPLDRKPTSYPSQAFVTREPTVPKASSIRGDGDKHQQKEVKTIGRLEKSSVKHLVTVTDGGGLTCVVFFFLFFRFSENADSSIFNYFTLRYRGSESRQEKEAPFTSVHSETKGRRRER